MEFGELIPTLMLLFFVAFSIGTALAYYFQDRFHLRKAYVSTFFICLLLVNIVGVQFAPLVHYHKFSQISPQETTDYEIRMVDEQGEEIVLDARAVEPLTTTRLTLLGEQILELEEGNQEEAAAHVFEEAQQYRAYVESDPAVRASTVKFPRHGFGYKWSSDELAEYGEFVGLRIYAVQKYHVEDGTEIEIRSADQVYEWSANQSLVESPS